MEVLNEKIMSEPFLTYLSLLSSLKFVRTTNSEQSVVVLLLKLRLWILYDRRSSSPSILRLWTTTSLCLLSTLGIQLVVVDGYYRL